MTDDLHRARALVHGFGLSVSSLSERCPDCRATVPQVQDGPTHRYLGASPGCWALYTAMLAREFSIFDAETHRLSVDAYAAQHPGKPSPQTTQSVCVHLVALCLTFEHGWTTATIRPVMGDLSKGRFFEPAWLSPPDPPYPMTIIDLIDANSPEEYDKRVRRWAETTWEAWSDHHDQVREWATRTIAATRHGP